MNNLNNLYNIKFENDLLYIISPDNKWLIYGTEPSRDIADVKKDLERRLNHAIAFPVYDGTPINEEYLFADLNAMQSIYTNLCILLDMIDYTILLIPFALIEF